MTNILEATSFGATSTAEDVLSGSLMLARSAMTSHMTPLFASPPFGSL